MKFIIFMVWEKGYVRYVQQGISAVCIAWHCLISKVHHAHTYSYNNK